jgi:hypothetical protein
MLVTVDGSLNKCERSTVHIAASVLFILVCFVLVLYLFYDPLFSVLSILLWKFLWLNEMLTFFLCLLLITRMKISLSNERYLLHGFHRNQHPTHLKVTLRSVTLCLHPWKIEDKTLHALVQVCFIAPWTSSDGSITPNSSTLYQSEKTPIFNQQASHCAMLGVSLGLP